MSCSPESQLPSLISPGDSRFRVTPLGVLLIPPHPEHCLRNSLSIPHRPVYPAREAVGHQQQSSRQETRTERLAGRDFHHSTGLRVVK
jgi:hypothetical protein